jgi:hypothetical protein
MLVGSTQTEVVVVGSDEVVVIPADVVGLPDVLVAVDVVVSAVVVGTPDVLVSAVVVEMLDNVDSIDVVVSAEMAEEPEIVESTEVTASLDVVGLLDTARVVVGSLEVRTVDNVEMSDVGLRDEIWVSLDKDGFPDVVEAMAVVPSVRDVVPSTEVVGIALLPEAEVGIIDVSEADRLNEVLVDGRQRPALTPKRFAAR